MKVWDAIAAILAREGVTDLAAFPTSPLIDACAAIGIRPVVCRQERVGVGIADGFSRTTGGRRIGVFTMQSGPGAENAYPGVATAYADSSPILIVALGLPKERAQTFPEYDSRMGYASITKSFERLVAPEMTVHVMRRAFALLRSGRPGPVVVEVPSDVGSQDTGDPSTYVPPRRLISAGDPRDVAAAAEALVAAERPLILAGQGVLYAEATEALVELADLLDAPVATTVGGKSAFPEDHPLALGAIGLTMGDAALAAVRAADTIFAIGCSLTKRALLTPSLPEGRILIHSTNDARDISKSYDVRHGILGDARLVLEQLAAAARERTTRTRGAARAQNATLRRAWLAAWERELTSDAVPLSAYRVVHDFIRTMDPATTIVTHDAGSPRDQLLPFYVATRPHGYIGWGKSHQLGSGLGFAIGAKLAEPEKLCVNWMGDAAFGMTGLDLETSVRSQLPILTIVLRNSTMAAERGSLRISHERYGSRDLGGEYCEIARALGAHGQRVTLPDEIVPALELARSRAAEGQACLIEFVTSAGESFSNLRALN